MKTFTIIIVVLFIIQSIIDIYEYFYKKYHNWDNDRGYQMWLTVRKEDNNELK